MEVAQGEREQVELLIFSAEEEGMGLWETTEPCLPVLLD